MPRLASVEAVRDRISADDLDIINCTVRETLDAATIHLEDELRTTFTRETGRVETFFVRSMDLRGGSQFASLRLDKGLVDEGTTAVAVSAASTIQGLTDDPKNLRSYPTTGTDHVQVDLARGLLRISDLSVADLYIRVTYDAGINVMASPNDDVFDESEVPSWLKEAAISQAVLWMESNPVLRSDVQRAGALRGLRDRFDRTVDQHARYYPHAENPIW